MDLIFILLAGYAVWWVFSSKKRQQKQSDRSNMTDTQRKWHEYRLTQQIKDGTNELDDRLQNLDPKVRTALQKLMEMNKYIATHKRQFVLSEWAVWNVEPQFIAKYCTWMVLYFVVSFTPMFWGWPVNLFFVAMWWLFIDVMFYKQKLVLEITEWNPEWKEKFGEFKDKYK